MSEEFVRLGNHLSSPLHTFFLQHRSHTLVSDESGTAVGGYCLETGAWWRFDLDRNAKSRLSEHVNGHKDLSNNVLKPLGMVITEVAFVVGTGSKPRFGGENVLMLGDNMAALHWISKRRGGKAPRSRTVLRLLGCLEMRSGWHFRAEHVKGVANTLAGGFLDGNVTMLTGTSANVFRASVGRSMTWARLGGICVQGYWRSHPSGSCGLVSAHLRVIFQVSDQISRVDECRPVFLWRRPRGSHAWALVGFAALCCTAEGNKVGTIRRKIAVVQ